MLQSMKIRSGLRARPDVDGLAAVDGDLDRDVELAQHLDDDLAVHGIVVGHQHMAAGEARLLSGVPCGARSRMALPRRLFR